MKHSYYLFTVLFLCTALSGGCAEFRSAGKTIGHATKDAATDIGHGTRRVAKEIAK